MVDRLCRPIVQACSQESMALGTAKLLQPLRGKGFNLSRLNRPAADCVESAVQCARGHAAARRRHGCPGRPGIRRRIVSLSCIVDESVFVFAPDVIETPPNDARAKFVACRRHWCLVSPTVCRRIVGLNRIQGDRIVCAAYGVEYAADNAYSKAPSRRR